MITTTSVLAVLAVGFALAALNERAPWWFLHAAVISLASAYAAQTTCP